VLILIKNRRKKNVTMLTFNMLKIAIVILVYTAELLDPTRRQSFIVP
jgi:hypothetical protein